MFRDVRYSGYDGQLCCRNACGFEDFEAQEGEKTGSEASVSQKSLSPVPPTTPRPTTLRASRDELTIEITMPTGRVGAFVRRTWRPIVADETDWELEPAAAGADTKKLRVDLTIAELERWEQPFASTA